MSIQLEVWGDYALFTRPEMKVERVSYDIMTPSAARGLVEAIYWHPGLKWIIDRIHVCAPIRFTNLRRNEVKSTLFARSARTVMERGKGELYLCTSDDIQQRAALLLRDVQYVIEAHFDMTSQAAPGDNPGKFQDIVKRRIKKGQFYHQPCFGCREFPAHFRWCEELPPCPKELLGERDLGWILYDMDYTNPEDIRPQFFRAPCGTGCWRYPPGKVGRCGDDTQALTAYYQSLVEAGKIDALGWDIRSNVATSCASVPTASSAPSSTFEIKVSKGKRPSSPLNELPVPHRVKAPPLRRRKLSVGQIRSYLLGADEKGSPSVVLQMLQWSQRTISRSTAWYSPAATAILAFFDSGSRKTAPTTRAGKSSGPT